MTALTHTELTLEKKSHESSSVRLESLSFSFISFRHSPSQHFSFLRQFHFISTKSIQFEHPFHPFICVNVFSTFWTFSANNVLFSLSLHFFLPSFNSELILNFGISQFILPNKKVSQSVWQIFSIDEQKKDFSFLKYFSLEMKLLFIQPVDNYYLRAKAQQCDSIKCTHLKYLLNDVYIYCLINMWICFWVHTPQSTPNTIWAVCSTFPIHCSTFYIFN